MPTSRPSWSLRTWPNERDLSRPQIIRPTEETARQWTGTASETSSGNLTAAVAGGLIILVIGYLVIDRKLRLQERADRFEEVEKHRRENREAVLTAVLTELEHNAAQLTTALAEVPKTDQRLVYPLFETTLWQTVLAPEIFTSLNASTIERLTFTYNRLETANEMPR